MRRTPSLPAIAALLAIAASHPASAQSSTGNSGAVTAPAASAPAADTTGGIAPSPRGSAMSNGSGMGGGTTMRMQPGGNAPRSPGAGSAGVPLNNNDRGTNP